MANRKKMTPGVVLAGGQSRRMGGRDKAMVSLAGQPLIDHVIGRLAPQVGPIAINTNSDPARFGKTYPILSDSVEDRPGPLAGILAALDWAVALKADWVVTVATDTPFLPRDLVDRLIRAQAASRAPIVLAETEDGLQPVTGLWYAPLAASLRGSLQTGIRRVTDYTEEKGAVSAIFSAGDFANINTPEDLSRAEARLQQAR